MFEPKQRVKNKIQMMEFQVSEEEMVQILQKLEVRKIMGPEKVSGHILKGCKQWFSVIKCLLTTRIYKT